MSAVSQSSDVSSHTSWGLNERFASIMDSIYAIAAGLGLRFVVHTVSRHNFKMSGTLVGLWEGVILLHFLKKMPKSTDPYVAFAVRLFIDFIVTESVSRLVLVLIWTSMGIILADVAPAIWEDVGLRRIWRRLRRDLYTISRTIPTVVFFPPTRTVRFSPSSRESSVAGDPDAGQDVDTDVHAEAASAAPPSAVTTERDSSASNIVPTHDHLRRRLPGYFPGASSETDSLPSTAIGTRRLPTTLQNDPTRTSRRQSVYPTRDYDYHSEDSNDLDELNVSSTTITSSKSTETGEPHIDFSQVTDIPDEEEPTMQTSFPAEESVEVAAEKDEEEPIKGDATPRQQFTPFLPPTPSDSLAPHRRLIHHEDKLPVQPTERIPVIPDVAEEPAVGTITGDDGDDWVNVQKPNAERPPTPPEKDRPRTIPQVQPISAATANPAAVAVGHDQRASPTSHTWKRDEAMTSMNEATTTADEQRRSQPPPPYVDYSHDHEDIYGDEYAQPGPTTHPELANDQRLPQEQTEEERGNVKSWLEGQQKAAEEEKMKREEEERQKEAAVEEEARKQRELEEKIRKEVEEKKKKEEEAERRRAAEEARNQAKEEERRKEAARKGAEKEAEERKKEEEEAERQRAAEEKRNRAEEEERRQKMQEAARKQVDKEERERKEKADAEIRAQKRAEEEKVARQRREAEETAEEEARQAAKEQEAEEKRRASEAARIAVKEERRQAAEAARIAVEEERRQAAEAARIVEEERRQAAQAARIAVEEERRQAAQAARIAVEEERRQAARIAEETGARAEEATVGYAPMAEDGAEVVLFGEGEAPDADATFSQPRDEHGAEDPIEAGGDGQPTAEPQAEGMETESVVTEQSDMPGIVEERLDRLLLLKAQIVEMEAQIGRLQVQSEAETGDAKERIDQDLRAQHKVLRKMKRKEQRHWDVDTIPAGVTDTISLEGLPNNKDAKMRLQESLEALLGPDVTSLHFTLLCMPGKKARKQKDFVLEVLAEYKLIAFCHEHKDNARNMTVDVPPERFGEWLQAYRVAATSAEEDDFTFTL